MRCEECLTLLEELLDGETVERVALGARAHLAACASCSERYESLQREQEAYAGFLRGVELSPWARTRLMSRIGAEAPAETGGILSPWRRGVEASYAWIAARRRAVATALVVAVVLLVASVSLFGVRDGVRQEVAGDSAARPAGERPARAVQDAEPVAPRAAATQGKLTHSAATQAAATTRAAAGAARRIRSPRFDAESQSRTQAARFVEAAAFSRESASFRLSARDARTDELDRAAARHFEQTRLLLLSFKNRPLPEAGDDDVAYEKSRSRVLASRNALLRKEAGAARNRPAETLLERVEPLLLDIAHLPERASPEEVETVRRRIANGSLLFTLRAQSNDAVASAEAHRD